MALRPERPSLVRAPRCPAALTAELAEALLLGDPGEPLRVAPGRTTARVRTGAGLDVVVKRTTAPPAREGLTEHLRGARPRCPAEREFDTLVALRALGLPVPEPFAWVAAETAAGRRAAVVMQTVPHTETLRQRLCRDPETAGSYREALAALVAALHGAGWCHRDLYLEHVALPLQGSVGAPGATPPGDGASAPDEPALVLLDLGRARWTAVPRRRWFVKDLGALAFSAPVGEVERCAFLARYLAIRGVPQRDQGAWRRAVEARARRIARHTPRHVDAASREGGVV